MKLIIAGGRDFTDRKIMRDKLIAMDYEGSIKLSDTILICGMAKGADLMALSIFNEFHLPHLQFFADWKDMSEPCVRRRNKYGEYNALAGTNRNKRMGDEGDRLLAFWNRKSTGTKNMFDYMRTLNKPVDIVFY